MSSLQDTPSETPFLIFDAYGTLVELDDFYGRLQRGFAHAGHAFSIEAITHAAHQEMKHYINCSTQARDRESWLRLRRKCAAIMADALREQGQHLALSLDHITQILADAIRFQEFPETRPVLERLHAMKIPMGVLSNWDFELPNILEAMNLKKYFRFVLSSAEIGVPKPAPETFAAAIERARQWFPNLHLQNCFYIGDHYEKDVLPARAAGLTPLWLVRNQRDLASGDDCDDCPDYKVLRLPDLNSLVDVLKCKA